MLMTHEPQQQAVPAARREVRPASNPQPPVHCYSVKAAAEPGLLPNVIGLFAKNGLVPLRWHSDLLAPQHDQDEELSIDFQVAGLAWQRAEYLARCMEQIYGVHTVLISQKY